MGTEPEPHRDKEFGLPAIAAAAAALVSGIGALTLTGSLGRVQRNDGTGFAWAIALVVFGAAVWIAGGMIRPTARKLRLLGRNFGLRELVQALGVVFSFVGVIVGFAVAISTANDIEQPDVSLKLSEDGRAVVGRAIVNNLSSDDRLAVFVDGLNGVNNRPTNLYRAFVGPNGDGKASNDIQVAIPPGRYDAVGVRAFTRASHGCREDLGTQTKGTEGTGCAVLRLAEHPSSPLLTASWNRPSRSVAILKLSLEAVDTGTGPDGGRLDLSVSGVRDGRRISIYRMKIEPPPTGVVSRDLRLRVDPEVRMVCARASIVSRGAAPRAVTCPGAASASGAAVDLRMPDPE
jgi:hypothetical protein